MTTITPDPVAIAVDLYDDLCRIDKLHAAMCVMDEIGLVTSEVVTSLGLQINEALENADRLSFILKIRAEAGPAEVEAAA